MSDLDSGFLKCSGTRPLFGKGLANSETRGFSTHSGKQMSTRTSPLKPGFTRGRGTLEPAAETMLRSKLWVQPIG